MNYYIVRYLSSLAAALFFAPLLPGIINKVKAFFAGRKGPRVTQLYFDLAKLLKKEVIVSQSSGGIIRIAPSVILAFTMIAAALVPMGGSASPTGFAGDALLFFYLLGTCRVFSVLAAMDTASSFEGMGSAREVFFSALAEAAVFAVLAFLAISTNSLRLASMLNTSGMDSWMSFTPVLLTVFAMFLVLLAENCRVPFDDPETHLELTMIHEAMILDYSGTDLAAILYASSLKLWIFAAFIISLLIPTGVLPVWQETALFFGGIIAIAVLTGIVESSMARFRFLKIPPLLIAAAAMPILAILFYLFFLDGGVK